MADAEQLGLVVVEAFGGQAAECLHRVSQELAHGGVGLDDGILDDDADRVGRCPVEGAKQVLPLLEARGGVASRCDVACENDDALFWSAGLEHGGGDGDIDRGPIDSEPGRLGGREGLARFGDVVEPALGHGALRGGDALHERAAD